MSTLTLELNDSLFSRLLAASRERNVQPADLACESLERALSAAPEHESGQSAYDLMNEGFGCVDSGIPDLGSNPQHLEGLGQWRR